MSTKFHRCLLGVLVISLALAAFPQFTFADHSWGNYHWARTSNPFTLQLGNNVSVGWKPYLDEASTDWLGSSVLDTIVVPGRVTNTKNCKPTSGRVEVCSNKYGNNGWLGIAQIWISSSHITQAVTKLNDTYFTTAKYNTAAWKRFVMCQEVGHTFGLDHQDEGFDNGNLGTCMDYTSKPAGPPSNEHPNAHDYQQLETIYSHTDGTTTVGQTTLTGKVPPPFADIDSGDPVQVGTGQWGKLIRSTNHGRTELYELDLGGEQKVLTHVIWAEGEEEPPEQGQRRR